MDEALPGIDPAPAPAKAGASPWARRIVAATIAVWIIFPCVMVPLWPVPPPDDETEAVLLIPFLFAGLPGMVAASSSALATLLCMGALSLGFTGLEIFAWRRRSLKLAVALLLWLLLNMGVTVVLYFTASDGC